MGTFADTMYTLLLGWVQSAVQSLWLLVTGADAAAWFRWVLDNWLALVILLCLGGLAIDLIVHLLRWQPYRVWGSFLRRLTGRDKADAADTADSGEYRRWVYADGSTRLEEVGQPPEAEPSADADRLAAPIRPVRRAIPADAGKAYNQPYYPPQWQHTDDSQGGEA